MIDIAYQIRKKLKIKMVVIPIPIFRESRILSLGEAAKGT